MKARILVSENDQDTRNDIVRVLEGTDHQCLKAANRADVQAVFQSREELDLTLVGINLVKEDEALLAEVKERYPGMPVVVITAMNDISIAPSAIRNGAYDYLLKPFDREQLLATVRRALEKGPQAGDQKVS